MTKTWWARLILWGFDLLYHSFSWLYDFAAWIVSAGAWNTWITIAAAQAMDGPLLDMGCGKGVLLKSAEERGIPAVGLDESRNMLKYATSRLAPQHRRLVRAFGQAIPLKTGCFRHVTATFPAPYIFEQSTLNEIRRVLEPGGSLIILLTAEVTGNSLHERLIHYFSGFAGFGDVSDAFQETLQKPFRDAGFTARLEWVPAKNARLFLVIAQPV